MGFPGSPVVKSLPCNAGDTSFNPWFGKIPHAVEQLSPWATRTEPMLWSLGAATAGPVCLELVPHNKRSHCYEKA